MTAVAIARRLIAEERVGRGVKWTEARSIVAKQAGVAPGSLENLERGRLKFVDRIEGKLRALLVRKIEQRIASLTHELQLAKTMYGTSDPDVRRAEASLEEARKALRRE
jgi:hypothetical protein